MSNKTLADFIAENNVNLVSRYVADPPTHRTLLAPKGASHWRCNLLVGGHKSSPFWFDMGSDHKGDPDVKAVLNSLVSEACSYDNANSLEDFAAQLGYPLEEREELKRAIKSYEVCKSASLMLRELFDEKYDELLYDTESL